jgi:methionine synthase II (cobalamin-independent)
MVKIKTRQRITSKNKNLEKKIIKYNIDKLKEEDIEEIYQEAISQAPSSSSSVALQFL